MPATERGAADRGDYRQAAGVVAAQETTPRSQAGYPHAETEKKVTNFAEAKWTFGVAETYDDYLIDKDEQYLKGKLAEP